MTVKDYAEDIGISIAEVLQECKNLNIDVKDKDDMLSEDDIIMLDNTLHLISTDDEITHEEDEKMDELVEDYVVGSEYEDVEYTITKEKVKDTTDEVNSKEFRAQKKELYKKKERLKRNVADEKNIIYKDGITLYEIAEQMRTNPAEIIKKLLTLELEIGIKDEVSKEIAELIASEYKRNLKLEDEASDISKFEDYEIYDKDEDLVKRAPIVTIMGHVDHGKTSLLDYIRKSNVVDGEDGGITQRVGAYQIKHNDDYITFIDTPGHAAFTQMRARGASVTDIVIIIVAADDGVMPQTKEAIEHAKSANVPIIVAINKMDKPTANPDKVMQELAEAGLTPEEWGGEYPFIKISAITGEGIPLVLDTLATIAEVSEYKANPKRYAIGAVIESKMDKKVGGIGSLLIQNGTLRVGDPIVVGTAFAKVRSMKNDKGESILEAGPSTPVEITGLTSTPDAGDKFMAFETESEAKKIAAERARCEEDAASCAMHISLEDLFASIEQGNKEINIILKADMHGCEEAIKSSLERIDIDGVKVKVVRSGIGAISESDIDLAIACGAIVLGFNVTTETIASSKAKDHSIDVRVYTVIYKLIEEIEHAMKGMLDPEFEEKELGTAEVRKIFKFSKVGNIAGSYVTEGIIKNNTMARIIRDGKIVGESKISSIQRGKDTVKEVKKGFECGITLESYNDIKEKDLIVCYEMVEVKIK